MLARKRKTKDPCSGCGLHRDLCICSLIPSLDLQTRVCLIVHYKELKRTTNTGQLAIKSLVNSQIIIRGEKDAEPVNLTDLVNSSYRSLLFYPSEDAVELTPDFVKQSALPIQLIVPDGNWRQASKVHSRHPELKNVVRVKISAPNLSNRHLRTEHMPEGMATLQAIAQALGVIEGAEVMQSLLNLYEAKLKNTLIGRGKST